MKFKSFVSYLLCLQCLSLAVERRLLSWLQLRPFPMGKGSIFLSHKNIKAMFYMAPIALLSFSLHFILLWSHLNDCFEHLIFFETGQKYGFLTNSFNMLDGKIYAHANILQIRWLTSRIIVDFWQYILSQLLWNPVRVQSKKKKFQTKLLQHFILFDLTDWWSLNEILSIFQKNCYEDYVLNDHVFGVHWFQS